MSKRAEEAALKAYPFRRYGNYGYKDMNDGHRKAYIEGYQQAEKDTAQRALDWLKAHTKSYAGPIEDPFWTMFLDQFKRNLEE